MRGILLDPRTGRPTDEVSLVDQNAALAEAALRDGRFKRVVTFLERDVELGDQRPRNVGGYAWRDYVPGCEYMIASQTPVAGTAEALLCPAPFTFIPAGFLQPGKIIHLDMWGKATTAASSPGNLTLKAYYGTTTGGTALQSSAASALGTSQTNVTWRLEGRLTCQAAGTAGSAVFFGIFTFDLTTAGLTGGSPIFIPASGNAAVAIDTTTAQGLVISTTLGAAGDTMTPMMLSFESLN